jgi:hypothetical protein
VLEVLSLPAPEIIEAYDFMAIVQKSLTEVASEKACPSGY